MSLLEETKSLLRSHRIKPKKTIGQNFLVDPRYFQKLICYASLNNNDTVLEIGAGTGFLTNILKEKCKTVLAVEFDKKLVNVLREQLEDATNVRIIEGNILKVSVPSFNKTVSVPPYQISSRLLVWLFSKGFDCAVLVFQKEFADRLVATPGSEDYGWLTVFTYYNAQVELLDALSKSVFYPEPKVDSVITRLIPKRQPLGEQVGDIAFRRLLQILFTHRNRKVRGAILPYLRGLRGTTKLDAVEVAERVPYSDKRVRELAPEDLGVLANALSQQESVL
jgi:16S rRNA (adenine1518-N6/adenine1519-N6)-dimethyltransferase